MIFSIDRLQYSITQNKFFIYEFIIVNNIDDLINAENVWNKLYSEINSVDNQKINFIYNLENNINKYVIIHQQHVNDRFIMLYFEPPKPEWYINIMSIDELGIWFINMNAIDGQTNSKGLGTVRESNQDTYINNIIKDLYNLKSYNDDCGLEITKKLLGINSTRGFDVDLFQYIPSTNECIFYEFLKRESSYTSNIQAHPMRYCWNGGKKDNKMKFISLWRAKNYFNGKLYLINYSDDPNEKISICEILELDNDNGILAEQKYCMSKNVFSSWLKDMNTYNKNHKNYLADFKNVEYDSVFFSEWSNNKRNYGIEFNN